jgi:AcrR family transcriptional regulator
MRRVAERLGFTTMSLHRHIPGKGELTALMRETVFGEVVDRLGPYPTLGYIWQAGGYDRSEDPFEFGLKRVDGIAVLVRSRNAAPGGD